MNPWAGPSPWAPQPQWRPPMAPLPQAHTSFAPPSTSGGWDQGALIASLNQMALQGGASPWVLDTGATSHMSPHDGILLSHLPYSPSFITVGNGSSIPISSRGTSILPIADHTLIILFNSIMFLSLHILFEICYLFVSLLATITAPLSLMLLASLLRICRPRPRFCVAIVAGSSTPFHIPVSLLQPVMSPPSPPHCGIHILVIQHLQP